MPKNILLTLLVLAVSLFIHIALAADVKDSTPDTRVMKLLKEADMHYMIDEDGDYKISFLGESNHVQEVWVNSATSTFLNTEIRELWSVAYRSDKPFSAEVTETILKRSSILIVGTWTIARGGGKHLLVFRIRVPAKEMTKESLSDLLHFTAVTADGVGREMEKGKLWSPD